MKYLFLVGACLLTIASVITWLLLPSQRSEVPVLYWVSDPSPTRQEHLRKFNEWLQNQPDAPAMEVRLDSASNDITKKAA